MFFQIDLIADPRNDSTQPLASRSHDLSRAVDQLTSSNDVNLSKPEATPVSASSVKPAPPIPTRTMPAQLTSSRSPSFPPRSTILTSVQQPHSGSTSDDQHQSIPVLSQAHSESDEDDEADADANKAEYVADWLNSTDPRNDSTQPLASRSHDLSRAVDQLTSSNDVNLSKPEATPVSASSVKPAPPIPTRTMPAQLTSSRSPSFPPRSTILTSVQQPHSGSTSDDQHQSIPVLSQAHSDLLKWKRTLAFVLRFTNNIKAKLAKPGFIVRTGPLSRTEIQDGEAALYRKAQWDEFPADMQVLGEKPDENGCRKSNNL
ncbi:hypothetical protein Bhyg_12291 [Pseudolycoriella hygida]|uniref:Uncharacterized protein n=1 Tax=Pseudolycoriella hygida TaxID=35572 RepID=A0A9Q0MYP3_9DIPT|nr:hypothetical protein Bhyg_12291 [Pseudolycoriella hygida]